VESLFLNTVTYENEQLDAYMRRLDAEANGSKPATRGEGTP
jgi:hypothetical protein